MTPVKLTKKKKVIVGIIILLLLFYWFSLPSKLFDNPLSTVVLSRDGQLLGARIAGDGQWRFPAGDSVPYKFKKCIIAFEDKYFYKHPGVNLFSLFRAVYQDIKAGKIVSGGSTLTMQVSRMSSGHSNRTILNKLLEIIMATRIEISYSKDEILNLYASNAPFGGNVVGISAAAWRYYHRSPFDLSWAEAATLAVLPNAPSLIYPGKNQERLLKKRNRLLKKLYDNGTIDKMTYSLSVSESLPAKVFPLPDFSPRLTDRIMKTHQGQIVRTTIDYSLQRNIGELLKSYSNKLRYNNIRNLAVIVAEVSGGNIIAYYGNVPPGGSTQKPHGQWVDINTSQRSSGSTLKPLLYAGLFDRGQLLPQMLVPDIPTFIGGYHPQNFHREYDGLVPASEALARSLNVPAVRLLRRYGISQMLTLLRKAGFSTINKSASHYGLSLILGGAEIKPEDLAAVYASMARVLNNFNTKGYDLNDWHGLYYTKTGKCSHKPVNDAVLSAPAVWETFNALLDVNRPANESGWKLFSCTEKIAWKTGTSYGFRDAWSVGVTPKYVVTVWVGNADGEGRPGMTGLSTAAPLMFDLFSRLPDTTWFSRPSAVMEKVKICNKSGYRAGSNCPETHYQYVTKKSVLAPVCPYHKIVHLDATGSFRVNSNCEKTANMIHKPWFVIPPVYEYFYKQKHPDYRPLPPLRKGCSQMPVKTMDFIYPPPNTSIFIPRDFTGKKSAVIFRLSHSTKNAVVFWHLDNEYIGSTRNIHEISITPSPGSHIITVVDQNGNTISRRFEVEGQ